MKAKIKNLLDYIAISFIKRTQPFVDDQRLKEGYKAIAHANALARYCQEQFEYGCEKCVFRTFREYIKEDEFWHCSFEPACWDLERIKEDMIKRIKERKNESKRNV